MAATLALGALALAGGLAAALSHATVRRAGTNDVVVGRVLATLHGAQRVCQGLERIAAETAAVRVSAAALGPRPALRVELLREPELRPVASGAVRSWNGTDAVPVRPHVAHELTGRVCLSFRTHGAVSLQGAPSEAALSAVDADGAPLGGRLHVAYLRAGRESWWALAPTVVARIGRAHAWSGPSVALAAALLTLSSTLLAGWLLVRRS